MSSKLITLSVLKGFKIYKALLWHLWKNLSCWISPSKTELMSADIYFTPDQCHKVLWSHSWYDLKHTYIRGSSYLDGFKTRCKVRRKLVIWYLFLGIYFTGRGGQLYYIWLQVFLFIHLKTRGVSLRKIKYWNAQAQITSVEFPKSTGYLAFPLNCMF